MILLESNEILSFLQNNQELNTGCQNEYCLEAEGTSFSHHWSGKGKGNSKDKGRKSWLKTALLVIKLHYFEEHSQQKPRSLYIICTNNKFLEAEAVH